MNISRRSLAKSLGFGSLVAAASALFPEVANARTRGVSNTAADRSLIEVARSAARVSSVMRAYPGHTFRWDDATVASDQAYGWVTVIGQRRTPASVVYITALIDRARREALLVEHAHLAAHAEARSGGAHVTLAFDQEAPVWAGLATSTGTLVPDAGFPRVETLLASARPDSCSSVMSDICNLAAGGDSVLACAIFAESGFGAIGCGLLLLLISWYGCKKVTKMICG